MSTPDPFAVPQDAVPPGYGPAAGAPMPPYPGYGSTPGAPLPPYPSYATGYPQMPYGYAPPGMIGGAWYASWGERVGAYMLDGLIIGVPTAVIGVVAMVSSIKTTTNPDGTPGVSIGPGIFVYLLAGLIGFVLLVAMNGRGQTPGKKIVGIRLVKETTGQPIGFWQAFGRQLAHFIDGIILYIGFLMPLWDAKKQTIADKMMGTVVIRVR